MNDFVRRSLGSGTLVMLSVAACAVALAAQPTQMSESIDERLLDHAVQWSGPRSDIRVARFVRITDYESWKDFWVEHRGERTEYGLTDWPVVPLVNFDTFMVVGVLGGEQGMCNGYHLKAVHELRNHVRIRYGAMTFQVAMGFGEEFDEGQFRGHPYGLFVVPKSTKRIVFEEDQRRLIQGDPEWVRTHEMPAR